MGIGFILVNQSKKETITFIHLPVNTKKEIAGNPVSAAIVSWYLFKNQGDQIQFVSDSNNDWPFKTGNKEHLSDYEDKTDSIISELIESGILIDNGISWSDEDEPSTVYIRDISNCWFSKAT